MKLMGKGTEIGFVSQPLPRHIHSQYSWQQEIKEIRFSIPTDNSELLKPGAETFSPRLV